MLGEPFVFLKAFSCISHLRSKLQFYFVSERKTIPWHKEQRKCTLLLPGSSEREEPTQEGWDYSFWYCHTEARLGRPGFFFLFNFRWWKIGTKTITMPYHWHRSMWKCSIANRLQDHGEIIFTLLLKTFLSKFSSKFCLFLIRKNIPCLPAVRKRKKKNREYVCRADLGGWRQNGNQGLLYKTEGKLRSGLSTEAHICWFFFSALISWAW